MFILKLCDLILLRGFIKIPTVLDPIILRLLKIVGEFKFYFIKYGVYSAKGSIQMRSMEYTHLIQYVLTLKCNLKKMRYHH